MIKRDDDKLEFIAHSIAAMWRSGYLRDHDGECFFCTAKGPRDRHDKHTECPVGLALELYPEDT